MWFKLGLEDDHPNMQLPSGLTVVDVVRDYLSALYQHTMDVLYRKFERGKLHLLCPQEKAEAETWCLWLILSTEPNQIS
jgi:hypothetical protein